MSYSGHKLHIMTLRRDSLLIFLSGNLNEISRGEDEISNVVLRVTPEAIHCAKNKCIFRYF